MSKAHAGGREPSFPDFVPTSGTLIRWCAERWGDKTLAILADERLTYREAEERSATLARGLLASGVGKGTRVALLQANGPDWIVGWLAATRIGAVVALLNTYNKAKELGWLLRHCDAQVLLSVDAHLGPRLPRTPRAGRTRSGRRRPTSRSGCRPFRSSARCGRGATGDATWAGPIDELAGRADQVDR